MFRAVCQGGTVPLLTSSRAIMAVCVGFQFSVHILPLGEGGGPIQRSQPRLCGWIGGLARACACAVPKAMAFSPLIDRF